MFARAGLCRVVWRDTEQIMLYNFLSRLIIFGCNSIRLDRHAWHVLMLFLYDFALFLVFNDKLWFLRDLVEPRRLLIGVFN